MILFPAIDLKEGRCVRLRRGEMKSATVFSDDPGAQAKTFERQGFRWLHVVDLDGAFAGKPANVSAVERILASVSVPVQLGGGIRDLATVERWLERGIRRIILGTAAAKNPKLVKQTCRLFRDRIVIGIDARDGRVAVEGWGKTSELEADELAQRYEDAGAAAIVHTDIARDGMLEGLNIASTLRLASRTSVPVIASGGFASMADVRRLAEPDCAGLEGAIVGRALYDGRIDVPEALALLGGAAAC